jgi:hypothetical protein
MEQKEYAGDEDNIKETTFRVDASSGRYEPVLEKLKLKDGGQ